MTLHDLITAISSRRAVNGDPRPDWEAYVAGLNVKRDADAIRVLVVLGEPGVGFWRVWLPYAELAKDPRFEIRVAGQLNDADLDWCSVVWVQRAASQAVALHLERAQRLGKRMIFELDDYLREIPAWNPARHILKAQCPDHIEWTHRQILQADLVVTSTAFLAGLYRKEAKRIVVLENCVNPELWDLGDFGVPFRTHGGIVTIGWGGSNSHWDDVALIAPAIQAVIDEHPEVWFVRLGYSGPDFRPNEAGQNIMADPFAGIPHTRRFSIGWEPHTHTLPKYESLIDIAVAPLVYTDFSRAKSNVKFLQASMAGSATVATDIECYRMGPPGNPTRLIRNNRIDRWISALEELVEDQDLRVELGKAAHQYVLDNFDIRKRICEWADVLLQMGGEARAVQAANKPDAMAPFRPEHVDLSAFAPVLKAIGEKEGWQSVKVAATVHPAVGWTVVTIVPVLGEKGQRVT